MTTYVRPWVSSLEELDRLEIGGDGRVVLTHPAHASKGNLSLGQVLNWALHGPTRSFNVVVGYFNHQDYDPSSTGRIPTPSDLVEHEMADERGRDPDECAFRMLFGRALTAPAAHALRSWYWLCRWRHADEAAVSWRADLTRALEAFLAGTPRARSSEFAGFAWPHFGETGAVPLERLLNLSADRVRRMLQLDEPDLARFEAWRAQFLDRATTDPILDLLLYFVRMRAAVRTDTTPDIATFHPKIYLVERRPHEVHGEDVVVVAGSGNWSPGAFGRTPLDHANVEVSTVHRVAPLDPSIWSSTAPTVTGGLGASLATTAAHLYARGTTLASWLERETLSPADLDDRLALTDVAPIAPLGKEPEVATNGRVAAILRSLIERTLGLGDIRSYAQYERLFGTDPDLWSGRRPSRYQLDGALRLLASLEGSPALGPGELARPPERGAFLTDEPGLGKTLVAQIVVATLACERLRSTFLQRRDDRPLRISIIAPARIAGRADDGASASGWHAAAEEIRRAVKRALEELKKTSRDYLAIDPAYLASRTQLRVLSTTSFGRQAESSAGSFADSILDDWFHVASSEIVVIDESHNFRNGQAAATRAIRFLLTLPVPGEAWPLVAGDLTPDHGRPDVQQVPAKGIERRVLCLSATPFNNRLEDFITQIGHFARYQAWSLPAQSEMFENLRSALKEWRTGETEEAHRRAFYTLALAVARHLRSGRRLDDDEIKAEARERSERQKRRPDDEGPLYDWAFPYDDLRRSFAQVGEWLQGYIQGNSSIEDESDARARVDALLARLVVQRSRRRILEMMRREGTLAGSFRAPELPRHPLAIGVDGHDGSSSFEAKVLARLYDLLPSAVGAAPPNVSDRLNLFSYELGVRRGREESRTGGTDETAIRNAVGFQATGLIKRLQSSPYAFLRTLARGPLRRALFEFALLEAAMEEARDRTEAAARKILEAHDRLAAAKERLQRQWGRRGDAIAGLIGGSWNPNHGEFFRRLVVVDSFDQRNRFEAALERIRGALQPNGKRKGRDGMPRWLELLLADLDAPKSKLWIDIEVSLGWILEEGDEGESNALLDAIYRHLEERLVGLPMDSLRAEIDVEGAYADSVAKWLRGRLVADRRAAWLLALIVVLAAADIENRGRSPTDRLGPGGTKLLVFTEYADTQSYLLALLSALRETATHLDSHRVYDTLLESARFVVATLEEQAQRVSTSSPQARLFRAPIDAAWGSEWVMRARGNPLLLRDAIAHACTTLGWASSAGAGYLVDERADEDASEVDVSEGDDGSPSLMSDDPVLDAFSPWYQITPDPARPDNSAQMRARMNAAVERPVRTLLATEILAEGVNLQECGIVAHYDLPWNPTRLIQRNGRVDRRLDPRFEEQTSRRAICEAIRLPLSAAELYHPPGQIYHFTVLPIEPAASGQGDPPAERVRRVLTRKLKSVRVLFGLASWPVVLRAADAQRVLTGELEFETPGFRRRERLFEQWRRLADLGAELPVEAAGGTVVFEAPPGWFDVLRDESLGATGTSWDGVRAAIVNMTPRGRAIHSAVEWQVATKQDGSGSEFATAITGAMLLENSVVGWDYRQRRQADLVRWSFLPIALSLADGAAAEIDCPLSAVDDEGRARMPTSPTSFAEDILSVAIDAMLREPHFAKRHETVLPPNVELDGESAAWLRWYLARPFLSGRLNRRDGDQLLAQVPPPGRWNLWIIRNDGRSS